MSGPQKGARGLTCSLGFVPGSLVTPTNVPDTQVAGPLLDRVAQDGWAPERVTVDGIYPDRPGVRSRPAPGGQKYPAIARLWRRQWDQVIPFFAFPSEVRRIIYTINAIESLNCTLRTAVCSRGHFPAGKAATKLLYLVLRRVSKDWKMPLRAWTTAMTQFASMFGDRFSVE